MIVVGFPCAVFSDWWTACYLREFVVDIRIGDFGELLPLVK